MTQIKVFDTNELINADAEAKDIWSDCQTQGFFMEAFGDKTIVIPKESIIYMIG